MIAKPFLTLIAWSVGTVFLGARTPTVIEYGGRVAVDGQLFTSTVDAPGYFKCIVLTGSGDPLWSNDGFTGDANGSSAPDRLEPIGSGFPLSIPAAIRLEEGSPVAPYAERGHFKLRLGIGLNPLVPEVLEDDEGNVHSDLRLRIWFSPDGLGSYEQLSPDVPLGSVPFAIWAARAERVKEGGITPEQFPDGGIGTAFLNPGFDSDAMIEDPNHEGQFIPDPIRTDPGKAFVIANDQIEDDSISSPKLQDDAVTMEKIRPAFYQGRWSDSASTQLSLNSDSGMRNATVVFDQAFGAIPAVEADGWTVTSVNESGFTATENATIFNARVVDAEGSTGEFSSLAVVNGRPAVSYRYDQDHDNKHLKYAIAADHQGTNWPVENIVTVDSGGVLGSHTSLAVVNGRPAISYRDDTNGNLKYAIAGDADGATWPEENIVTVDSSGDVGTYTSLAVIGGYPAISYHDEGSEDLKFAISSDASGAVWPAGMIVTVDSAGNVGPFTSLAQVDGRPAIGYWDGTGRDLKYAIASDATGSTWPAGNIVTVDSAGDVGRSASLEVVNGRPAIAYLDGPSQGNLKYARAGDAGGASWPLENIVTVDGSGGVTADVSMVVINGRPGISYVGEGTVFYWRDYPKFVMADDADGANWSPEKIATVEGSYGDKIALAEVDGRPAVTYWSFLNDEDLKFAIFEELGGGWTARDPSEDSTLAARTTGVVDGAVTSTSLADNVGVWFRSGDDVYRDTGRVGIGTATPAAELHVVGTSGNNTGEWSNFSDRRLKENVAPLDPGSLERLLRLQGVQYDYIREDLREGYEHSHRGWIAQDVEEVFPEWVSEGPDGMKMVTPVGFRALAVEALRELRAEKDAAIAALKARNSDLKREDAELKHRIKRLEQLLCGAHGPPDPGKRSPREIQPNP